MKMMARYTCQVVRAKEAAAGVTGFNYAQGISSATVGAKALCLQLATIPPGARTKAHLHRDHESAAYVISGQLIFWFGEGLRENITAGPGDFIYIPPGVPHLSTNGSNTEPVIAVLARTDPNEHESTTLLPELDGLNGLTVKQSA
jgi:uncharacterized RmlC-like cupin family protein